MELDALKKHRENMVAVRLVSAGLRIEEDVSVVICPYCKREGEDIKKRRKNSAYVDDNRNYTVSCLSCYEETVEYYSDMWADFWSGVM